MDWSAVEEALGEAHAKRYIEFCQNTGDEFLRQRLDYFIEEVEPVAEEANFRLNSRIMSHHEARQYVEQNAAEFFKQIKRRIELFRKDNVAIQAESDILAQQFSEFTGELSIDYNGQALTMEEAAE